MNTNYTVIVKVNGRSWKLSKHQTVEAARKAGERWLKGAKKYETEVSYEIK